MKKAIILALFSTLFLAAARIPAAAEPENYCDDKQTWAEWADLIAKYPNDEDVQTLHALRIGLCIKVKRGSITFEQANDIFNRAHESVIRKRAAEQKKDKIPL